MPAPGFFATTRWTLVVRASGDTPEARAALGELCEAYWMPVFRFLCREGRSEDDARELTQEFFARVLARSHLQASPDLGRFRTYLLGALKHFLADQHDRRSRQKRGGGQASESLDVMDGIAVAAPGLPVPDEWFDREWALTLMERALQHLQAEFSGSRKAEQFEVLKGWLAGDAHPIPQAEAASRLGLTEGAVKVAIHRLRRRFRETLRQELADTLPDSHEIDEELRYLVAVLSHPL